MIVASPANPGDIGIDFYLTASEEAPPGGRLIAAGNGAFAYRMARQIIPSSTTRAAIARSA